MTIQVLDERRPVARKRHECNACQGFIAAGDRYYQQKCVDGGYLWTYRSHELCAAIFCEVAGQCFDDPEDIGVGSIHERLWDFFGWLATSGRGGEA